jgi:lysozyme family protein
VNFDDAFTHLIGEEGGYVNNPKDPGGETKFGISKRQYPDVDIKNLTLDGAKAIYRRDYWDVIKGDEMPYAIAFETFDAAVNHGTDRATLLLQEALGVSQDGEIGTVTLATAQAIDPNHFRMRFSGARLFFYTLLPTWPAFGKGWVRRVAANLKEPS